MIEKILGGGQSGADQAGWRAARAFGITTGGAMPKGFLTEEGPRPEFAELYRAVVLPTASYPHRTERNVRDSDGTLWFGDPATPGGRPRSRRAARSARRRASPLCGSPESLQTAGIDS
jgi:hypothetical protein